MNNSFNVLPSLVQTNFTFWRCRHKIFSSSKITGISSQSTDLHPHSGPSGKLEAAVLFSFLHLFVFFTKLIWLEDSTSKQSLSDYTHVKQMMPKAVICLGSHDSKHMPLQSSVHVHLLFPRKIREKKSKKKKEETGLRSAFYSVCVCVVSNKAVPAVRLEWGRWLMKGYEERDIF